MPPPPPPAAAYLSQPACMLVVTWKTFAAAAAVAAADGAEVLVLAVCGGWVVWVTRSRIPVEVNVDLQHGVSFNKGCYLGQELTARTQFKARPPYQHIPTTTHHPRH